MAVCFKSDKFRANRFLLLHDNLKTKIIMTMMKMKANIYNTSTTALRISFLNAIIFWGVSNEPPSHKDYASMSIILEWLPSLLATSANCVFPPPLNCQRLRVRKKSSNF